MKFANVTMYTQGGFGITRTDVKEVTIEEGVKYAQYTNAVRAIWKEPRQRTARSMVLTYEPFLIVLNRADAFDPDDSLVPGIRAGTQISRYGSCDPRWTSDFMAQMESRGITPLYSAAGVKTA